MVLVERRFFDGIHFSNSLGQRDQSARRQAPGFIAANHMAAINVAAGCTWPASSERTPNACFVAVHVANESLGERMARAQSLTVPHTRACHSITYRDWLQLTPLIRTVGIREHHQRQALQKRSRVHLRHISRSTRLLLHCFLPRLMRVAHPPAAHPEAFCALNTIIGPVAVGFSAESPPCPSCRIHLCKSKKILAHAAHTATPPHHCCAGGTSSGLTLGLLSFLAASRAAALSSGPAS